MENSKYCADGLFDGLFCKEQCESCEVQELKDLVSSIENFIKYDAVMFGDKWQKPNDHVHQKRIKKDASKIALIAKRYFK